MGNINVLFKGLCLCLDKIKLRKIVLRMEVGRENICLSLGFVSQFIQN